MKVFGRSAICETAVDRVVIGDGDEIHPAGAQLRVELPRIRVAVRKIEPAEEPFFRALAEARMNVKIAAAHARLGVRCRGLGSPLRDPVAVGGRRSGFRPVDRSSRVSAARFPRCEIRRMNAEPRAEAPAEHERARRAVPGQAGARGASVAHAVNERARGKIFPDRRSRTAVRRVVYSISASIAARSASVPSSQAGAMKPRGFKPAAVKFIPRARDSRESASS